MICWAKSTTKCVKIHSFFLSKQKPHTFYNYNGKENQTKQMESEPIINEKQTFNHLNVVHSWCLIDATLNISDRLRIKKFFFLDVCKAYSKDFFIYCVWIFFGLIVNSTVNAIVLGAYSHFLLPSYYYYTSLNALSFSVVFFFIQF